jgi:hypothetical protein
VLIPVVEVQVEIGLYDVLLLKEKATDEVQGLAFRVLLHVNRNRLVNIHIFCHHIIVHLQSDYSFSLDLAVVYSRCQDHTVESEHHHSLLYKHKYVELFDHFVYTKKNM